MGRIVAPLAPRTQLTGTAGTLTPHATVWGAEHVLLVPSITTIATMDLTERCDAIGAYRNDIIAALDFLFLGIWSLCAAPARTPHRHPLRGGRPDAHTPLRIARSGTHPPQT